jgi:branched-chain amino acid transport system ATP-binding protein
MSVRDNLLVGAYTARNDIEKNLELVHSLFPVLRERRSQETATQSGGERQMVSLGRALMTSPRILLVDEPTIGLAPKICAGIADALVRLNKETGLTILIAEQNVNFAMQLASHIHVLETGSVAVSGPTEELKSDPELAKAYFGH